MMPQSDHPSLDLMIAVLIAAVLGMGVFACFWKPAYPEGFQIALQTFVSLLMGVVSAKYALTQAKPDTTSHTVTPPADTAAPIAHAAPDPLDPPAPR